MNPALQSVSRSLLSILLIVTVFSTVLVPIIALTYSYNTMSAVGSGIGFFILLTVSGFVWLVRRQASQQTSATVINCAITIGILLGLLWIFEISINNFIAPSLPARDIIDNSFWGIIALVILAFAISCAYHTERVSVGIVAGTWSGFVSGAFACCMGLSLIVFCMRFITQDPLNVAEWSARGLNQDSSTMAAYFAYETFAGAFLHLSVLGIFMGMFLGVVGGMIGKVIRLGHRVTHRS
jgi:hypothetical protein